MKSSRSVDLHAIARDAMVKYGFEPDYPPAVLKEAAYLPKEIPVESLKDPRTYGASSGLL